MLIYTGSYSACKNSKKVISISGDRGKTANYKGRCYSKLAPKKTFWKKWRDNIGKIPVEENTRYYIREYYNQVLKHLDPLDVLNEIGEGNIMLCYEHNFAFCHRHIVAAWLEIKLHINVEEVMVNDDGNVIRLSKPEYIKKMLIEVMKESEAA